MADLSGIFGGIGTQNQNMTLLPAPSSQQQAFANFRQPPQAVQSGNDGIRSIDDLIRARTPQAVGLINRGTTRALRLADIAAQQIEPLRQYGDLSAFNEQQALLGLSGEEAQRAAISGIPISEAQQQENARQREEMLRMAAASGDVSGASLLGAERLGAAQSLAALKNRLAELEPLAAIARSTRSDLSSAAESARARRANLLAGRGTQLANIRLGAAAPQISSIQNQAELAGLRGISAAQQQANIQNQLGGLIGTYAPQIGSYFSQPTVTNQVGSGVLSGASSVFG